MHALYVFDAYGTLFDVHSAIARHAEAIGPEASRMSETWRIKQIEYTWNYSLIGRWRDFRDITAAALDTAAAMHGGLPSGLRDTLIAAYEKLDAYPDVAPTLKALRARGAKTAILSNGSREMLDNATRGRRAARVARRGDLGRRGRGLQDEPKKSTIWSSGRSARKPTDVAFQSSNRWDVAGAKAFGFQRQLGKTVPESPNEYLDLPPDRVVRSLDELLQTKT